MSYPETHATMRDLIEEKLQDSGNAIWGTGEVDNGIIEGLRELSKMHPYIYRAEFNLESRRGTANGDTTNALVDSTLSQFLSSDVGKWVYNSDDRKWAVVTAYVDETQLTLSNDAFPDGNEAYRMFNEDCTDSKEFNIIAPQNPVGALGGRHFDFLYIDKIEFPILQDPPSFLNPGQWEEMENGIVRLKVSDEPDNTKDDTARDEVWVYFAFEHQLSRMTTLLGKVDLVAGYAAGLSAITVDDLNTGDVIYKGQLFTIDSVRGIYIADYQRTVASGESLVTFYPPLLDAVTDNDNVRFISNTMKYKLEGVFADLVAGKVAVSKARTYINKINYGPNPYRLLYEWGKLKYNAAIEELEDMRGFTAPSVTLP